MNLQYNLSATRGVFFSKAQSGGALVGDALLFLRAVRGGRVSSALMATAAMTRPEPPSWMVVIRPLKSLHWSGGCIEGCQ